ncbi:tail fiber protein [Escherichia coli]|uniref:tail fiber protein n=2 Tax=Escherichia coli TaxID=562 RepID=UPI0002CC052C|nr:tail fiber protein [Escherichia coli]EMX14921.1 phage tail fiber repeat family protein [Escherichia coli P0302293.2]END99189.1 phage tail fiber repeat family protein [Escherichia coli P0302293.7]ENE22777.1 phage tail fiber repeat family protein [Escherichia coli P0302293.3]ENE24077.1 phage tail fiber repeat family protein [Escherichia coli P0302293.10]ENE30207.1 phage tail fiber repeat family protein [Escherichia coli P0302293.4]
MSTTTRKFKTVITDTGEKKLAQAATPDGKPVRLTHMAVGDGGGTLPTPDSKQTRLVHEVWRHTVNRVILDATHQNRIIAELVIPPETGGFWIREIGVFDEHGDLIAVGNTAESYKPTVAEGSGRAQTFRTILTVSSTATVALTVDNTMVMATVDYVNDKLKEHEQSRRHPDASLTARGFVQLSSATNSTSETLAATPKAVKAAYDLANAKYTAQDATTARKGIVQLSSTTNSTSETLAATPKAVKAAYDLANGKYTAQDATTARKGLVQLSSATNSDSETLAATPKAVKTAYDLANGKYTAQDATTARKGLVQLSSAINSDSETLAATPKAVKSAYDNAEKRLQKDKNGADIPGKDTFTKNIGACRAYSGALSTEGGDWTTAQFIEWLDSVGAFNHPYWMCKGSWSYANNKLITDTGCGNIHLAGAVIEVMGIKSAMTIRITTPTTSSGGGATSAQFTYINHGDNYAPGWRRDWNRYGDSMSGTINQDSGSQNAYMSTALCSGTRGGKKYLRKFRGGEGDTIWHETVQGGVIRWATGNYDAQEELSLSSAYGLRSRGEITSLSANGLRIAYGNYGFFIRNDGGSTYLMLTASGDKFGAWNGLRPLTINNANGGVSMGHGLSVTGDIVSSTKVRAGSGKKFTVSSSNTSTKEAAFNLWGNASRPVVAELGDDAGWHFYSQRNTDNSITFAVNGQVSPSNYGNFDSRYVRDIRLGGASSYKPANNGTTWTHQAPSGCAYTGIIVQDTGSNSADNIGGVYYRPIQKNINGTWYNVSSV